MALQVQDLIRVFKFDGQNLADPNPTFSIQEVVAHYSVKHPELTTATVAGPEIDGQRAIYEFKNTVGTKG